MAFNRRNLGQVVPSSLVEIASILRVADAFQPTNPRVAYLCRFYALEKACRLDHTSIVRDVDKFKNTLVQRLERDDKPSLVARTKNSDAREMHTCYKDFYKQYVQLLLDTDKFDRTWRTRVTEAYQISTVLFEVLKVISQEKDVDVEDEISNGDSVTKTLERKMENENSTNNLNRVAPPLPPPIEEGIWEFMFSSNENMAQSDNDSSRTVKEEISMNKRSSLAETNNMIGPEVVPMSLVEIKPILRTATEVSLSNPRVAYLCRFYAFEKVHRLDPSLSGHGVREFQTALLERLERENESTLARKTKCDASEMTSFYERYYTDYKSDCARLTKTYQSVVTLFEVLKAVNPTQLSLEGSTKVADKIKTYEHKDDGVSKGHVGGEMGDDTLPPPPPPPSYFAISPWDDFFNLSMEDVVGMVKVDDEISKTK